LNPLICWSLISTDRIMPLRNEESRALDKGELIVIRRCQRPGERARPNDFFEAAQVLRHGTEDRSVTDRPGGLCVPAGSKFDRCAAFDRHHGLRP
jgi:hypothetical protein